MIRHAAHQQAGGMRGFTLIELLLVIGIIAILASIVIIAINPTRQMAQARDAKRQSDVDAILNAVYQYAIDHQGRLPSGIPVGTAKEICVSGSASCQNGVNLDVLTGGYLTSIPVDPRAAANGTGTEYFILHAGNGRVTVSAPLNEVTTPISATR